MDNKKSETLSQREKAQKDLIELKKMQQGQLDPSLLNDDDKKIVPRTLDEKCDNFFYHNKQKLIIFGFLAVVLSILIVSCATRTNYDATLTIYCYEYIAPETVKDVTKWVEGYHADTNENGAVEILVTDCSFSEDTDLADTVTTQQMKIQSLLMDKEAMLFILDDNSLEYLNSISKDLDLFAEENIVKLDDNFYKTLSDGRIGLEEDKDHYLCLRTVDRTALEGRAQKNYEDAKKVLEAVKAGK